jgi:Loader and inhibitor of phage G40P
MNKEQVYELFQLLTDNYPTFKYDQRKLDTWHRLLVNDNHEVVIRNAENHILNKTFVPTIADIRETKHPSYEADDILEKIKKWESEASGKR